MDIDPAGLSTWDADSGPCSWDYIQIFEGDSTDGPLLGKWCNNVTPPPVTSTGNSLTLHLFVRFEFVGHFVASYSVLNTGVSMI